MKKEIIEVLLKDRSTDNNILWCTDNYKEEFGNDFFDVIKLEDIVSDKIKPRNQKNKEEQLKRVKEKAEVFTPLWVVATQGNMFDDNYFGKPNVFCEVDYKNKTWSTTSVKIEFENETSWQDYVSKTILEITCGEAPYLVSRYDPVSGEYIEIKNRIGMLDRKLRVICENTSIENEFLIWAYKAYQSTYGFEWQGDNLILARINMFKTFNEYYKFKFNKESGIYDQLEIAQIISWNIFQMDGLKFVTPMSCKPKVEKTLFGIQEKECISCKNNTYDNHTGTYVKIMDWEEKSSKLFQNLLPVQKYQD